jgi:hypothetical protein
VPSVGANGDSLDNLSDALPGFARARDYQAMPRRWRIWASLTNSRLIRSAPRAAKLVSVSCVVLSGYHA